jgi:hypothetical protein
MNTPQQAVSMFVHHVVVLTIVEKPKYTINIPLLMISVCRISNGIPTDFDKAEANSQFLGKYIHNNLIIIRVSLICKFSGTPD